MVDNERIYRSGYAWLLKKTDIQRTWVYRDEVINLPAGAVAEIEHRGLKLTIAHIEGVRTAHERIHG